MDTEEYYIPNAAKDMTDAEIYKLSRDLRDEIAGCGASRQLLEQFVHQAYSKPNVSIELITYLRDAFNSYLCGNVTVESALGLKRRTKGQPKTDPEYQLKIACHMLNYLLDGDTQEKARAQIIENYAPSTKPVSDTYIKQAWKKYKYEALKNEQIEHRKNIESWTVGEHKILEKLYPASMIWDIKPQHSDDDTTFVATAPYTDGFK